MEKRVPMVDAGQIPRSSAERDSAGTPGTPRVSAFQRIACGVCFASALLYFAGCLYARNRANWPIARYCMYCHKAENLPTERNALFGLRVDDDGNLVEENLLTRDRFRRCFWPVRYRPEDVIELLTERSDNKPPSGTAEERLAALLNWYERRREAGRHDGPRYLGIRLYVVEVDKSLDVEAHENPRRIRLLAEHRVGTSEAADGGRSHEPR